MEAIAHIDYDFGKLKVREYESQIIAIRSRQFDVLTSRFLKEQPDSIVLHLGCGMDSRVFRVDAPATVQWFDVDYPDVIELRRRLYPRARRLHDDRLGDRGAGLAGVPAVGPAGRRHR